MQIEGVGKNILLNDDIVERNFPFEIAYEGDLIYEVVRVIDGLPLFWKEHVDRMIASLNLVGQAGQEIVTAIEGTIRFYIAQNDLENNNIKVIIGNFSEDDFEYMAYYVPSYYPDQAFYKDGAKVVTLRHERENPNAKVINNNLSKRVVDIRRQTGAYEVALINHENVITEGSRSNLFFLKDDCVYISQGHKILKGITMHKVITLFKTLDLVYKEENITQSMLPFFDACFMTSTSNNILPIDSIDTYKFDSSHHLTIQCLMKAFEELLIEDQAIYKTNYKHI